MASAPPRTGGERRRGFSLEAVALEDVGRLRERPRLALVRGDGSAGRRGIEDYGNGRSLRAYQSRRSGAVWWSAPATMQLVELFVGANDDDFIAWLDAAGLFGQAKALAAVETDDARALG